MNLPELKETIANLTVAERMEVLEILWETDAKDEPESPAWHGEVLAERMAKAKAGKAKFLTLEELDAYLGL